ncbi:hypothetical protein MTO96_024085 [Rhipicephalus appendiculatus]
MMAFKLSGLDNPEQEPGLYHWQAPFDFRNGLAMTVEFNRESSDGDIVATLQTMTSERAAAVARKSVLKYRLAAPFFTSIKVANAAMRMHHCGKYHIGHNNCQTTLTELLRQLGLSLPPGVKTLKHTLSPARLAALEKEFQKKVQP